MCGKRAEPLPKMLTSWGERNEISIWTDLRVAAKFNHCHLIVRLVTQPRRIDRSRVFVHGLLCGYERMNTLVALVWTQLIPRRS